MLAVIFVMLSMSTTGMCADDACYPRADEALFSAKTWTDLRLWFENYPLCDDGYYGEGVSEFVTASLAKKWESLKSLQQEIRKSRSFKDFVLTHIDATTDEDNLKRIVNNARTRCPLNLRGLCTHIENSAQMALKEMHEVEE